MWFNFERIFLQTDTLVIDSFEPLNVLKSWTERVVKLGSVHLRIHFLGFLVRINLKTLLFEWSWMHTNPLIIQNLVSKAELKELSNWKFSSSHSFRDSWYGSIWRRCRLNGAGGTQTHSLLKTRAASFELWPWLTMTIGFSLLLWCESHNKTLKPTLNLKF